MHHRLYPSPDCLKTVQPQQVESCASQRGHGSRTIAAVTVGIHVQLGVSDPVPALDAPAVSNQMQQGFWGGAQAGENRGVAQGRLKDASSRLCGSDSDPAEHSTDVMCHGHQTSAD